MRRERHAGIALVAALMVLAAVAALVAARATVQALAVATVDAQRRELAVAADVETGLAWAIARVTAPDSTVDAEVTWPLPRPLEGTARVRPVAAGVRILVHAEVGGSPAQREVVVSF